MTDELEVQLTDLAKTLGMSKAGLANALRTNPTKPERKILLRKWKDKIRQNSKQAEAEANKRWYEQQSVLAEARHGIDREEARKERERRRQTLPDAARLQSVMARAELLESRATSPALGNTGGHNSERPAGPPGVGHSNVVELEPHLTVIRKHIELLENKMDAYMGLIPPVLITPEDRGKLLDSLAGVHSKTVSQDFPDLGSQRTVEQWRKDRAAAKGVEVSPSTGLPK